MTNLEKIETDILSLLEEYKQRFNRGKNNSPSTFILSESDILRTPEQRINDLTNEMDYAKGIHIIKFGNENEADIDKLINTSLQSFVEYQQTID